MASATAASPPYFLILSSSILTWFSSCSFSCNNSSYISCNSVYLAFHFAPLSSGSLSSSASARFRFTFLSLTTSSPEAGSGRLRSRSSASLNLLFSCSSFLISALNSSEIFSTAALISASTSRSSPFGPRYFARSLPSSTAFSKALFASRKFFAMFICSASCRLKSSSSESSLVFFGFLVSTSFGSFTVSTFGGCAWSSSMRALAFSSWRRRSRLSC
mmetsp:Transcript_111041/g.319107  ORF Transcript_111041/g.319107 Transcript_111041/m.319107 type:complete len:217 (+) Transcript_111041:1753-2403(+)